MIRTVIALCTFVMGPLWMAPASSIAAEPAPGGEAMRRVVEAENAFAADLFGKLRREETGNLFFSPLSVSTALTMTYAGAEGETAAEMAKVLHIPGEDAGFHQAMGRQTALLTAGKETPDVRLKIANRLWGQEGKRFEAPFLQLLKTSYGAGLGTVDFRQTEAARRTINGWVSDNTERKIPDLFAPGALSPDTRLVLTNAVYFKAGWMSPFEKNATADAPFRLAADRRVTAPLMHRQDDYRYAEDGSMQALALPYGKAGLLSMVVLLPRKVDGLGALEERLTAETLRKLPLAEREVNVYLPRFKMRTELGLGDTLKGMGMARAFSNRAEFPRISREEELKIDAVVHEAFVEVNEEGTEAAAATGVALAPTSAPVDPPKPAVFRADHPFVFLIRDNRTGAILFMGRVTDPTRE